MKQALYADAYSEEEFRDLLFSWSHISKFQESGSVYIYHKGEVLRRHEALCKRPDLITTHFRGNVPIIIDIDTGNLEDPDVLEKEFQKHEENTNAPIYWICGIDRLLVGKSESFFHYLRKRQAKNPTISYVLFFNINFLHPTVSSILTYTSTFIQNTVIMPLHDKASSAYFLYHWTRAWKVSMSEKILREVVRTATCHFTPLKQAVRFVRDTGSTNVQDILHHPMMQIKLKSIYDGLLRSEQTAILKVVVGANDFTPDEAISIEFLKQTRWLEARGHRLYLTIPLLAEYVESLRKPNKRIEISGDRLVLGDVPIDTILSSQEQYVLRLFVQRAGHIVTRDEIAKAVWKDNWENSYSDWAIDQLISRVRKKCVELNFNKSIIQAVKGKGFRYDNS